MTLWQQRASRVKEGKGLCRILAAFEVGRKDGRKERLQKNGCSNSSGARGSHLKGRLAALQATASGGQQAECGDVIRDLRGVLFSKRSQGKEEGAVGWQAHAA
jgi:hypothetical protein